MKSFKKSFRIIILFVSCIHSFFSCGESRDKLIKNAFINSKSRYLLYVDKKEFTISIYNRDLSVVEKFKIGYGLNPDKKPKLYEGDDRTPEGTYKITEILSMNADKNSGSYKKLKLMNEIYFRAKDGHYKYGFKDKDLGENVYGPRFFLIDYPNIEDKKKYKKAVEDGIVPKKNGKVRNIGYGIAIHGNNDPESIGFLCSSGCVRMYNDDIVKLDNYIELGTPVIILSY